MVRLHDTALEREEELVPRTPGTVSMYVCGPTVYGPAHLGHGRFSLVFDIIRRYLEWTGLDVVYVSNITDIDDKIVARAAEEGITPAELARREEASWVATMEALGVRAPTHSPHATAYVDDMIKLIDQLLAKGAAYVVDTGVYFRTARVPGYGLLAHRDLAGRQAGARVASDDQKEDPADFALWKRVGADEPGWDSPWGHGRPGWHTECVVMSLGLLGEGFDIHGGGQDLAFPHHENERAQLLALGVEPPRHWVHNGFVEVGGEKMSKSLGNFIELTDLLERFDPRAYRMLCVQAHYRSPIEVTEQTAAAAGAALDRIDAALRRSAGLPAAPADPATLTAFTRAMDADFDTPAAAAVIFRTISQLNTRLDAGDEAGAAPLRAAVTSMLDALGLRAAGDGEVPAWVAELLDERQQARGRRDWARADAIRDQLAGSGWTIEDTASGPRAVPS